MNGSPKLHHARYCKMCLSAHEFYIVPFVSVHCRLSFEFTRAALNYGTEHWEHSEPLWENKSNPKMPKHAETSELDTARKGVKPSRQPSRITITIISVVWVACAKLSVTETKSKATLGIARPVQCCTSTTAKHGRNRIAVSLRPRHALPT